MSRSTVAGVEKTPPNWKLSITGHRRAVSRARERSSAIQKAVPGT
jgi:hypothetical protein